LEVEATHDPVQHPGADGRSAADIDGCRHLMLDDVGVDPIDVGVAAMIATATSVFHGADRGR
jgi:hypothetical protein